MVKEIQEVYKEMSKQASDNGYYLIPKSFYEKLFNGLDSLKIENNRLKKINNRLRNDLKDKNNDTQL